MLLYGNNTQITINADGYAWVGFNRDFGNDRIMVLAMPDNPLQADNCKITEIKSAGFSCQCYKNGSLVKSTTMHLKFLALINYFTN